MKYTAKIKIVEYAEQVIEAESIEDAMDKAFEVDIDSIERCEDEFSADVVLVTDENGNETAVGW